MVILVIIYILVKFVYNDSDCKKNRRGLLNSQISVQFVTIVNFTTQSREMEIDFNYRADNFVNS